MIELPNLSVQTGLPKTHDLINVSQHSSMMFNAWKLKGCGVVVNPLDDSGFIVSVDKARLHTKDDSLGTYDFLLTVHHKGSAIMTARILKPVNSPLEVKGLRHYEHFSSLSWDRLCAAYSSLVFAFDPKTLNPENRPFASSDSKMSGMASALTGIYESVEIGSNDGVFRYRISPYLSSFPGGGMKKQSIVHILPAQQKQDLNQRHFLLILDASAERINVKSFCQIAGEKEKGKNCIQGEVPFLLHSLSGLEKSLEVFDS